MSDLKSKRPRKNVAFPSWKSTMTELINQAKSDDLTALSITELRKGLSRLDIVKKSIHNFHSTHIIQLLSADAGTYQSEISFDKFLEQFQNTCIADNQFFTVYDIQVGWHTEIDTKFETVMGMDKSQFSLPAMAGLDPLNPLFHPDDVNHMIRWAGIAYLILSFPGFNWRTLKDFTMWLIELGSLTVN